MRRLFALAILSAALAVPAHAQGLMADMHADVADTQKKLIDLAKAIPESAYGWRPGAGVRSVGEVLQHVAADNYILPVYFGKAAPAATGITKDYKTAVAYETRKANKAAIVADLEASFKHLHEGMNLLTDQNIAGNIDWFGQPATRRKAIVSTVTHLHEHLGQMIAYARSNGVKPPWSN
ncbi:MAG: DinB family protein [Gemmatimonadaceae bacterium]|jgi:uncharacterized damage-inducible protein DinB|nr:DinB family protein [Gemmatimonadaceae bacterium]